MVIFLVIINVIPLMDAYFIAITFNRRIIDNKQHFDSVWMTRDWKPINIRGSKIITLKYYLNQLNI